MNDLIILGAGPAGLAAALYAGRFRLKALVLEKMVPGGQIILSPTIENYPGFPGGITTDDLVNRFKAQVDELGVPFISEEAVEVREVASGATPSFNVVTSGQSYPAKALIIACGAHSRRLGVPGEDRLTGKGVSYCGTCDGPFFKNREVAVVGGGDRAIEDALLLANYCSKVTIVHRRQEFRASQILVEKAQAQKNISFLLDSVLEGIQGESRVEGALIRNVKTGQAHTLSVQGVFIFVGIVPSTGFVKGFVKTDDAGFIITDQDMRSSRQGVFACGDCRVKSFYQVVSACGEGAHAADSAHKYLLMQK